LGSGKLASYIPELARADPSKFALVLRSVDGHVVRSGHAEEPFTFQSVSKVFTFCYLLSTGGDAILDQMPCEPSGDAFHSIVRLEDEHGHPRNPYINAGAIMVSDRLRGSNAKDKIDGFVDFLRALSEGERLQVDERVYASEFATGNRNRALAHYMNHYGLIDDPAMAVDTYFRQCSLTLDTARLARIGLFLANRGRDPETDHRVLTEDHNRTAVALMATCGLYDEVGRYAIRVGVPSKSGVSGPILAVVPGRMTIAAYSPELGPKGNSVAGMTALTVLSKRLRLSVFG
jgi:glutaminase